MSTQLHILALTAVTPGIRGALNNWYLEPLPGLFLGTTNTRIREHIQELVHNELFHGGNGYGIAAHRDPRQEQGIRIDTLGHESPYQPTDFHGFTLINYQNRQDERSSEIAPIFDPGW